MHLVSQSSEKEKLIERQNIMLLKKLQGISSGHSIVKSLASSRSKSLSHRSLNYVQRRKTEHMLIMQNMMISQRLLNTGASINKGRLDKEYFRISQYKTNIRKVKCYPK